MKMFGVLCLGALVAAAAAEPATAVPQNRRSDQEAARKGRMEGQLLPVRAIEARIVPAMERKGAQYMGFDFDAGTRIYTLKFLRKGNVIWIDVDGRTGKVLSAMGG